MGRSLNRDLHRHGIAVLLQQFLSIRDHLQRTRVFPGTVNIQYRNRKIADRERSLQILADVGRPQSHRNIPVDRGIGNAVHPVIGHMHTATVCRQHNSCCSLFGKIPNRCFNTRMRVLENRQVVKIGFAPLQYRHLNRKSVPAMLGQTDP